MFFRNFLTSKFLVVLCTLTSIAAPALADCTPTNDLVGPHMRATWIEGGLVYDTTNDVLKTCDGTNYIMVGGASLTGGTSGYLGVWSGATNMGLSSTVAGQQLFWDSTSHRLGIGTSSPAEKLTVAGNVSLSGGAYIGNVSPTLYLLDSDHRSAMIHNNGNLLYFLRGAGTGSTSWAQYNSYWPLFLNLENNDATFGGNVYAFGYYHNSDARLKEKIETLDDGLGIISKLRGVSYQWKHDHAPALGVIAQDVEKVIPSAVKTNSKGDKTVEYDQLIGPLIEAVKELKADKDALRVRIEHLESVGVSQ